MNPTLATMTIYIARIAPALPLGGMMLFTARRNAQLRIVVYLSLFILLRDAMPSLGHGS